MKLFGFEITRTTKTAVPVTTLPATLGYGWLSGGWPWRIEEPFTGAWQRNMELRAENVLTYAPVYRCITIISNDIAKLNLRLVEKTSEGIWVETESPAFSPVLRKQNAHQTRQDFIKRWMFSKLIRGNAYILKERDNRGIVTGMYVLDPFITYPYISEDGSVIYQCGGNKLAGINDGVQIPASEIIHDRNDPLFHDLCGLSPIIACGLAAMQAINSQVNWNSFFANGSTPSGLITAPGIISDKQAKDFKDHWEQNYTGPSNVGKVAVLGGGLEYKPMMMNAVDAELIKQLEWTAENVCTAFGVPSYMVGIGDPPNYNNIEALNQQYYSQALQAHIESIESKLDEGLGLESSKDGRIYGTEFDLDDLLRMDSKTLTTTIKDAITGGFMTPDEGRFKMGLGKTDGGDKCFMQQQMLPLDSEVRVQAAQPKPAPAAPAPEAESEPANDNENEDEEAATNEQRSLWLTEGADASRA